MLRFNATKCKVMHVSHKFPTVYQISDGQNIQELTVVDEEKDLGVFTTNNLKSDRQCAAASAKAMSILGIIRHHFKNISISSNFNHLYKTYIRPHLEYCIQAWCPNLVKDIACLEKVQRKATKLVSGFKNKSYSERLSLLGLTNKVKS